MDISIGSESSYEASPAEVKKYLRDATFPWLISFPRTGSHWLRMVMELYFKKPSLVRAFYYHPDQAGCTCYHRHDENLNIDGVKRVIYLYRDPVDTVYSRMMYAKENLDNKIRIYYWAELYGRHLNKWLAEEQFSQQKVLVKYEHMKNDFYAAFAPISDFFGSTLDKSRLKVALSKVSKQSLKNKSNHDSQVINAAQNYDQLRQEFRIKNIDLVRNAIERFFPHHKFYLES